jgi:3-deoxy-manno-octulosonate cytidylyltransferase (CMP-KDO synthetase)
MIQHVWEAARASSARHVVVATDDKRIRDAVAGFGGEAVMTARDHASGSDRIAECARQVGWDKDQLIVNLQGDEPGMPAICLDQVAELLESDPAADAATLFWPMEDAAEIRNPNMVKVVCGVNGDALCFSRSPIPFPREYDSLEAALAAGVRWNRHLGLYCYRNAALQRFTRMEPTPLESLEKLEQLRILENGGRIRIAQASAFIPAGIDTPEDLERARSSFSFDFG